MCEAAMMKPITLFANLRNYWKIKSTKYSKGKEYEGIGLSHFYNYLYFLAQTWR